MIFILIPIGALLVTLGFALLAVVWFVVEYWQEILIFCAVVVAFRLLIWWHANRKLTVSEAPAAHPVIERKRGERGGSFHL